MSNIVTFQNVDDFIWQSVTCRLTIIRKAFYADLKRQMNNAYFLKFTHISKWFIIQHTIYNNNDDDNKLIKLYTQYYLNIGENIGGALKGSILLNYDSAAKHTKK